MADFEIINRELENFSKELAERPQIVAANKSDMATPNKFLRFAVILKISAIRFLKSQRQRLPEPKI